MERVQGWRPRMAKPPPPPKSLMGLQTEWVPRLTRKRRCETADARYGTNNVTRVCMYVCMYVRTKTVRTRTCTDQNNKFIALGHSVRSATATDTSSCIHADKFGLEVVDESIVPMVARVTYWYVLAYVVHVHRFVLL